MATVKLKKGQYKQTAVDMFTWFQSVFRVAWRGGV